MRLTKAMGVLLVFSVFIFTAAPSCWSWEAEDSTPLGVEVLLVRPLGAAATVVGSLFYVITLPFTAALGQDDEAADALVHSPYEFTFERHLGEPTHRGNPSLSSYGN